MSHNADEDLDLSWIEDLGPSDFGDHTPELLSCPTCDSLVHEEIERCPFCGHNLVPRSNAWRARPWWWVVLGLAGVTAVLWLIMP